MACARDFLAPVRLQETTLAPVCDPVDFYVIPGILAHERLPEAARSRRAWPVL
jgi:hypothetical protein